MGVRGYNNTHEPNCEILLPIVVAITVKAGSIKDCWFLGVKDLS